MWTPLRKHCTDEQLLAFADGELDVFRSAWVKAHIELCWDCRARQHELEAQTERLSVLFRGNGNVDPGELLRAKTRFHTWQQQYERELATVPEPIRWAALPLAVRIPIWVAIACLLLIAIGSPVRRTPARNEAADLLSLATKTQARLFQTSAVVHQTFVVKVSEVQPKARERTGKLEVWSDGNGQRFSSRWNDTSGTLRHAVWRPRSGQQFYFNPAASQRILNKPDSEVQVQSLLELSNFALDINRLESGLMDWIETRRWRPIELGADMRLFSARGGSLRVERTGSSLCLQAEESHGQSRIELLLELAPDSYEPRVQRIRFVMPGRTLQIELAAGECELVDTSRLQPAVFQPQPEPGPEPEPKSPAMPGETTAALRPAPAAVRDPRTDVDGLAGREVEVQYALHRLGACLGEQVRIVRTKDEQSQPSLEVHGLVESNERRLEIVRALSDLPAVKIAIKTTEEVLPDDVAASPVAEPEPAGALRVSNRTLDVERELDQLFKSHPLAYGVPTADRIARFSTNAISLSQKVLAEAWALERHSASYPDEPTADLPPQSRWLLEIMVRDHFAAMKMDIEQTGSLLEPLLPQVTDSSTAASPLPTDAGWSAVFRRIRIEAVQMDGLVRSVFAGAEPPPGVSGIESGRGAVAGLAQALEQLRSDTSRLDGCLNSEKRELMTACEK
jgi:hypothetical protein